jgi:cytochrome P450
MEGTPQESRTMPFDTLPGPKGIPVLGMALEFYKDPYAYASFVGTHGDLVAVPFPGETLVYVLGPDLIEKVLVTDARRYGKGRFASRLEILFGDGILLAEGDDWKRQRRRMAPAFTHQAVHALARSIGPITIETLDGWTDGEIRDVHADMTALTLDVALQTLFGTAIDNHDLATVRTAFRGISAHFARAAEMILPLPLWVPTPSNVRFKTARAALNGVVSKILAERRTSEHHGDDLLGRLLHASDEAGDPITDSLLQDEVRTLLLAGHETTAVALTVAIWELAAHPDVQAWVQEEVDAIEGPITVESELPRIQAVFDESMRVAPPAPVFSRSPIEDVELDGHHIPAGTTLILSPFITQRRAPTFDDPYTWRPSRWTSAFRKERHRFAYFPFGGGPRVCIGVHLALAEARIVLGELVRRFHMTRAEGTSLKLVPSITMRPAEPVRICFQARR